MKKLFAAILFAFSIASAPAFGACSFLCNDGSGNGTFGNNLTVEGTLTVNGGGSTTFTNLTVTGDLTVQGNTTLGNASGDTLTINAGAWTIGNNIVATRSAGTVAAGATSLLAYSISFTGDAGGTSQVRGLSVTNTAAGANTLALIAAGVFASTDNTSNAGFGIGVQAGVNKTLAGALTQATAFYATPATISAGSITTYRGIQVPNIGSANITNAFGIKIDDFTNSATMRGIQSSLSSGSGKRNLYIDGTAVNFLNGETRIGSDTATAGAEKLQITGSLSISDTVLIRTYTAFANGAAAAVGTLNNAPAAGNPTKWIPVNDNGTTRYIPAW